MGKVKPHVVTYEKVDAYCFKHYGITFAEKLEEVQQDWIRKLEAMIILEGQR